MSKTSQRTIDLLKKLPAEEITIKEHLWMFCTKFHTLLNEREMSLHMKKRIDYALKIIHAMAVERGLCGQNEPPKVQNYYPHLQVSWQELKEEGGLIAQHWHRPEANLRQP